MGGDRDDSGDDNGEDDEDNNNADEDPEEEEDDDPLYHGAEYHKHFTKDENDQFCVLLREVLHHLGYTMKPLNVTKDFSEPGMRDYYTSRVYICVHLVDTNGWRNRSSEDQEVPGGRWMTAPQ
jgi:TATA-binding protein-associated factor Taf7